MQSTEIEVNKLTGRDKGNLQVLEHRRGTLDRRNLLDSGLRVSSHARLG